MSTSAEQAVAVGRVVEVEHDAALAAVRDDRPDVDTLRIAARRLDLDDVGAVVAERHGGDRPGEPGGQVDDPQSFQCAWHASPLSRNRVILEVDHARRGEMQLCPMPRSSRGSTSSRGLSGRGLRLALAVLRRDLRRDEFGEALDGGTHGVDLLVQHVQAVRRLAAAVACLQLARQAAIIRPESRSSAM